MNWIKTITLIALLNILTIVVILKITSFLSLRGATPTWQSSQTSLGLPSPTLSLSPTTKPTAKPTLKPTAKPTLQPTSTPTIIAPTATPAPKSDKCIVTIDGSRYDITVFQNIHSGGNVFTCGTDQSALFHGQHPDSFLSKMARYKI